MKRRNFIKSATIGIVGAGIWTKNVYVQPIINKVTDPAKIVTDPVILSMCSRMGIDKDYVEYFGDYKYGDVITPCAKYYRYLLSKYDTEIMVCQNNPHRRKTDGEKIIAQWVRNGDLYVNRANTFGAVIDGTQNIFTALNDQPYGLVKANDTLNFQPRLFANGVEVNPVSSVPKLLATDPINPDLTLNVLEWDYGICKRWMRLIEGGIRSVWYFPSNPKKDIRIVYNQSGVPYLKLGQYATSNDEEFISAVELSTLSYPFIIYDSATYYPDADPETAGTDGYTYDADDTSWAALIALTGDTVSDNSASGNFMQINSSATSNQWNYVVRSEFIIYTELPTGATKDSATFSVFGDGKADNLSITPSVNIYYFNTTSETGLVAIDHNRSNSTVYSSAISYGSFNATGWNDFVLNATGLTAIPVGGGYWKTAGRNSEYDAGATPPSWSNDVASYMWVLFADNGSNEPKLVVNYTAASSSNVTSLGSTPQAKVKSRSGTPTANIKSVEGTVWQ